MTSDRPTPTLADDEAALAGYADALIQAVEAVLADWIRGSIAVHAPELAATAPADRAVREGAVAIGAEVRTLLQADLDDQREGPLQVIRRGTRFATKVLGAGGTAPAIRDEFAQRAFPDDVYDLAPAAFVDVHPSLHEPGLVWGAAKAHVHLRRRRQPKSASGS